MSPPADGRKAHAGWCTLLAMANRRTAKPGWGAVIVRVAVGLVLLAHGGLAAETSRLVHGDIVLAKGGEQVLGISHLETTED